VTTVPYQVRVSSRAKYPRLKMSAREGLVVVVPDGFDESRIPSVLDGKREWIRRNEERFRDQVKFLVPQPLGVPPERISLRAIGEEWSVQYRRTNSPRVTAAGRLGRRVLVYGDVDRDQAVRDALCRWLFRKTREHVAPWLEALSRERGLPFGAVTVRSQRTRWASCSPRRTISLNVRLMFLPHHLVQYVLLHELAHTREMNHSRRYWTLLESLQPNYLVLDRELRDAWRLVPAWIRSASTLRNVGEMHDLS
jgi:predicted metal-dependent hydrolase